MEPLITVVIPVYKVEKYLKKCINSVLQQSYKNLEIILIDDGSPDNCPQICDEYLQQDKRVRVIHQENRGLSAARNKGIELAKGKYISFVDSDDYISENMIDSMLLKIEKYEADIAITSMIFITEDEDVIKTFAPEDLLLTGEDTVQYLLQNGGQEYVCNKMFKKELFQSIRFPLNKAYEDSFIMYKMCLNCRKIVFLNESSYFYLQRNDSITSSCDIDKSLNSLEAAMQNYELIKNSYPTLLPYIKRHIINICGWIVCRIYDYQSNKNKRIIKEMKTIIKVVSKGAYYPSFLSRVAAFFIKYFPFTYSKLIKLLKKILKGNLSNVR